MYKIIQFRNNLSLLILVLYPLFFILGSAILNIFNFIFVIINIDNFKNFIKDNKNNSVFIAFFIFFIYCLFSSFHFSANFMLSFTRSLSLLLHGLFFFIFWQFSRNDFNHKKFIKILMFFILIINTAVLADTAVQFFFGKDLFGFVAHRYRLSGPFGDEYIVGSFLYKFSLVSLAAIIILFEKHRFIFFFYLFFCFIFILLSGERSSFLLFILSLLIFLFLYKKNVLINYLKYFLYFVIFSSIIFYSVLKFQNFSFDKIHDNKYLTEKRSEINYKFNNKLINNTSYRIFWMFDRLVLQTSNDISNFNTSSYFALYKSAISLWENHKLFGVGLKNFRIMCNTIDLKLINNYYPKCSTHPHNYILEILVEIGLIGLFFFFIFIICLVKRIYNYILFAGSNNCFVSALVAILFSITWPLVPTGSFFSSFNSSFFWFFLGLLFYSMSVYEKSKKNN